MPRYMVRYIYIYLGFRYNEVRYIEVFTHRNYCNVAGPEKILCYNGHFVISGFVILGFHCMAGQI